MSIIWHADFAPSYTPEEMLWLGIFEGKYINNVRGLPKHWYDIDRVLGPDDAPDVTLNRFGVKCRLTLREWRKRRCIGTDPNGWFEWYCRYWLGRRLPNREDRFQIARWRNAVKPNMLEMMRYHRLHQTNRRLKQRQMLLQWGWDSTQPFVTEQLESNLARIQQMQPEVELHYPTHTQQPDGSYDLTAESSKQHKGE